MTDRELLEKAAKACGLTPSAHDGVIYAGFGSREWNPLADDGDAFCLQVDLRIDLTVTGRYAQARGSSSTPYSHVWHSECSDDLTNRLSPRAAARLAITKVAAQIGETMP